MGGEDWQTVQLGRPASCQATPAAQKDLCESSWPFGCILLLDDALPLLALAGPATCQTNPLAMAANDSTALAIPGQVIPIFHTKRREVKTVLLQVQLLSPAEQNAANMAKLEQQVTKLLDCSS